MKKFIQIAYILTQLTAINKEFPVNCIKYVVCNCC